MGDNRFRVETEDLLQAQSALNVGGEDQKSQTCRVGVLSIESGPVDSD